MSNRPVDLLLKNLALALRKHQKELQASHFENTGPFDGVFKVTDANGRTHKVSVSPKSTLRDLEKMV